MNIQDLYNIHSVLQITYGALVLLCFISWVFIQMHTSFQKRKVGGDVKPTDWIDALNLPAAAKNVHLKEFNKQTERKFTAKWFREYWQGQRSAFYAWLTWSFIGAIIVNITLDGIAALFISPSMQESWFDILTLIIGTIYSFFASVILWRCAKNSTRFYKYFARLIALANVPGNIL